MLFCNLVYVFLSILTLLIILIFDNVDAEFQNNDEEHRYVNHEEMGVNDHQRRALDALNDKEWHVSHLKDMDFDANCEKETFDDKIEKYRKTLRNDGALVKFVSADAIPVNKKDLEVGKCKRNLTRVLKSNKKHNSTDINRNEKSVIASDIKPATVSVKNKVSSDNRIPNVTNQRRSDYQFSSVEYYDEFQDFNADACPNTVEVIELELDTLRSYDVVCEATLEWRSLE